MTDQPSRAAMAYITQPQADVILLNLQLQPGVKWPADGFARLELTQRQLANILVDGAAMALRHSELAGVGS